MTFERWAELHDTNLHDVHKLYTDFIYSTAQKKVKVPTVRYGHGALVVRSWYARGIYNVPFCNLLSFISHTCSVITGVRGGVIAKIRSEQPKVIDINCILCHLVTLVVKAAT